MRTLLAGLLAFSLGGLALAQDDKKPEDKKPQAERLAALKKDVQDSLSAAIKAQSKMQAAQKGDDADAKKEAQKEFQEALSKYQAAMKSAGEKAVAIAKDDPKTDAAADALSYAFGPAGQTSPAVRKEILGLIREHHVTSSKIRPMVEMMARSAAADKDATAFVEEVIEKNPSKEVKAAALLGLGQAYKNKALPYSGPDPKDFDESVKKAEEYLTRVEKEYGDLTLRGKQTFGAAAKSALAGLKNAPNLRIGKTIPDIEGEDTDGQKFKLSDYRGKVVVLDFWGHW